MEEKLMPKSLEHCHFPPQRRRQKRIETKLWRKKQTGSSWRESLLAAEREAQVDEEKERSR